ncbi:MAG: hypothetical protein IJA70_05890, partial [Oscillospiraceae bacterium]|nr:hypothetical protein [Oscillospiraceae bacterium]
FIKTGTSLFKNNILPYNIIQIHLHCQSIRGKQYVKSKNYFRTGGFFSTPHIVGGGIAKQ